MGRRLNFAAGGRPLVSVILCTFERARLVRRAIRSVTAQRYTRWELIIVDDGSTDETPEVLAPMPLRDPRIILLRQRNRGLVDARNAGLRIASGEYVCFLDSDDEFSPTHISSRVRYMDRHRSIGMIYGGVRPSGPVARRYVADLERPGKRIHVKHCFVGGTFFIRRSIIQRGYRFAPVGFGEDLELIKRIRKKFAVRKVRGMQTYIYHCEGPDRMSDAYDPDGGEGG